MKPLVVGHPLRVARNLQVPRIAKKFHEILGSQPTFIVSAPGRVNLIGEHTDYNNGYVFPVAIDKYLHVAVRKRDDRRVRLYALDLNERCEFSLEMGCPYRGNEGNTTQSRLPAWSKYLIGVAYLLQESGRQLVGMDALITGNVPIGAGLSSSAALSVSAALAFLAVAADSKAPVFGSETDKKELAALCQRAEHEFVGVNCGIMDQTISLFGRADHALFLDCQSLEHVHVPLNLAQHHIVVCNTKVKRELAASEYNKRRAECEKGVDLLSKWLPGISSLRDVTLADFKKYEEKLPALTQKRCRYVIEENARVLAAVSALKDGISQPLDSGLAPTSAVPQGALARFGKFMNASHAGLRDDYEVSCNELDLLTDIAGSISEVIGARMTGAGFGGCTVSIVHHNALEVLCTRVMTEYPQQTGIEPEIYLCNVSGGASVEQTFDPALRRI